MTDYGPREGTRHQGFARTRCWGFVALNKRAIIPRATSETRVFKKNNLGKAATFLNRGGTGTKGMKPRSRNQQRRGKGGEPIQLTANRDSKKTKANPRGKNGC